MVYLLEPKRYTWGKVPYLPQELLDKQVQGVPLQQSDIPAESELKGRFALRQRRRLHVHAGAVSHSVIARRTDLGFTRDRHD